MSNFKWDGAQSVSGSYLVGYMTSPWTFQETVARLITLSGQDPTKQTDQYKTSVEFYGYFKGKFFTLYDYKNDDMIHVGGHGDLNVNELSSELVRELKGAPPTPYRARYWYEGGGQCHQWEGDPLAEELKKRFKKKGAPNGTTALRGVRGACGGIDYGRKGGRRSN